MLLGISYVSLNGLPVFVDLHLAAGLALLFLAVLRYWSTLRRNASRWPKTYLLPGLCYIAKQLVKIER
jgi:cytochrome b561